MAFDFLAGVRVLDLSQYLPGPLATQMLADLGARVLKIEPPAGDPLLGLDPVSGAAGGDAGAPFHGVINAGKSILRLDLKSDAGKRHFSDLVSAADVVLESYRPGVMDRLGFGSGDLRRDNPALIHCSLSGYGQTGPLRLTAGHDLNYMAHTGALGLAGTPEGGPAMAWPPMADCAGAVVSALAILGALVRRGRTGAGETLDVAMADCVLAWQAWGLTAAGLGHEMARGETLLTGGAACYRPYETADGRYLAVGALEPVFWRNFCDAVGRAEWAARQGEPLPQRGLIAEVAAHLATRPLADWLARLEGVDTCVHSVVDHGAVADQPQVRARGLVREGAVGVEVLLPLIAGGGTSGARPAPRAVTAETILEEWRDG